MVTLYTGKGMDVAIKGEGFFVVGNLTDSNFFYTRKGNFDASKDNYLVTKSGYFVLDQTNKPISLVQKDAFQQIAVVCFEQLERLIRFQDGLYRATNGVKWTYQQVERIEENALDDSYIDLASVFTELMKQKKQHINEKSDPF